MPDPSWTQLTPAGEGGVHVLLVQDASTPPAFQNLLPDCSLGTLSPDTLTFTRLTDGAADLDDVLVVRCGEQEIPTWELNLHGSMYILRRTIANLEALGYHQAEVRALVSLGRTPRATEFLLRWREEHPGPNDAEAIASLRKTREGRAALGERTIVLAGAPNAGKSTLFNALVGEEKAIVTATAGTTRDWLEAWISIDGWPVKLIDTAGLGEFDNAIDQESVKRAQDRIASADAVVFVVDPGDPDHALPREDAIVVINKQDLGASDLEGIQLSALTGEGLNVLRSALSTGLHLPA
jgi:small GTP-binding protein